MCELQTANAPEKTQRTKRHASPGGVREGMPNLYRSVPKLPLNSWSVAGVWTVGLAGYAPKSYSEIDLTLPTAFVVGGEGEGLRRLVRERCDWLVSIPMQGHVQSLNVSVATGVALFEAVRQRRAK